jgi:hypothetical protein
MRRSTIFAVPLRASRPAMLLGATSPPLLTAFPVITTPLSLHLSALVATAPAPPSWPINRRGCMEQRRSMMFLLKARRECVQRRCRG